MPSHSSPRIAYFRRISQASSLFVLVVGLLVLFGWGTANPQVRRILLGVSPHSAFTFVLAAVSLLLLTVEQWRRVARALACMVALIALLRLGELLLGIDLARDRLLFFRYDLTPADLMAPYTAIGLLALAVSLLLFNARSLRWLSAGQICAIGAALLAAVTFTGHVFDLRSLYTLGDYPPISTAAGCLLFFLGVGLLTARVNQGSTDVLVGATLGGAMARRVLPLAVVIPTLLIGLEVTLSRAGLFGDESGLIVFAALTTIAMVAVFWRNAATVNEMERERNQAEEAMRASEARYRALFENSTDAILLFDEQGQYLDANPQAERLLGYSRDEIITRHVGGFAAHADEGQAAFTKVMRTGHLRIDYTVVRKDGSQGAVEFLVTPVAPGLYQTILHDIGERKQVEEYLRRSLEQERQLNEMKARFVSMVSHDFRSPLAVIRSATDMLINYSDRMDAVKRRARLEKIQTQVRHLVELLDDILTIGRAETIGADFHPEPVDLRQFCAALVAEVQPAAPTHRIQFHYAGDSELVGVDPKLLKRALVNLITNAVKYSPQCDHVLFDVTCAESGITLRVQDAGIGIPEADQPHLFEVFYRASNVGTISGTGLGLPIVKQMVDAHGGTIGVESCENQGTTFTITLQGQQFG